MGRILLSICALVVAVGMGASTQKADTPHAQQTTQTAQSKSDTQAVSAEPAGQGQSESGQNETAREANQIAEKDLFAQRAMAILALFQLALTGGGLYLIWETLAETRKAVKEASDATDAAKAAVDVTRQIGETQLRAYITIVGTPISVDFMGTEEAQRFILFPTIKNNGVTPARRVNVWTEIKILAADAPLPEFRITERLDHAAATVGAGSTAGGGPRPILWAEYEGMIAGRLKAYLWVRAEYETVFPGTTYHTEGVSLVEPAELVDRQSVGDTTTRVFNFRAMGPQNSES